MTGPAEALVATHCVPPDVQLVQEKFVGLLVQFAVSTTLPVVYGVRLFAESEQVGGAVITFKL